MLEDQVDLKFDKQEALMITSQWLVTEYTFISWTTHKTGAQWLRG